MEPPDQPDENVSMELEDEGGANNEFPHPSENDVAPQDEMQFSPITHESSLTGKSNPSISPFHSDEDMSMSPIEDYEDVAVTDEATDNPVNKITSEESGAIAAKLEHSTQQSDGQISTEMEWGGWNSSPNFNLFSTIEDLFANETVLLNSVPNTEFDNSHFQEKNTEKVRDGDQKKITLSAYDNQNQMISSSDVEKPSPDLSKNPFSGKGEPPKKKPKHLEGNKNIVAVSSAISLKPIANCTADSRIPQPTRTTTTTATIPGCSTNRFSNQVAQTAKETTGNANKTRYLVKKNTSPQKHFFFARKTRE